MMRCFRHFALSLLLSFTIGAAAHADITPEVVTRCKHATAFVLVEEESEGTAFHIGQGLFVTNAHVVEQAGQHTQSALDSRCGREDAESSYGDPCSERTRSSIWLS